MTALKGAVLILILANLGYWLWARGLAQPAAPAPSTVPSLTLASEAADKHPIEAVAELPAAPANGKRCVSVGPFRDVAEAARASTALRGGGYESRQRVTEGDVWAGVWVYLPLAETRNATDRLLERLKAIGIDDAMEMPGPNDGSVISLGVFSEPNRAAARVALAKSLGMTPGVADRKRTGNVYWLDIDLKSGDTPPNSASLHGDAGQILRVEIKACPATAAP